MKTRSVHSKSGAGFTLVDLMAVVGVCFTLMALLLPAFARAKTSSVNAHCKSNLREIGLGMAIYTGEARRYPLDLLQLNAALFPQPGSVDVSHVLWCPAVVHHPPPSAAVIYGSASGTYSTVLDYGYNTFGSGTPLLELGLVGDGRNGVAECKVSKPFDMITVSDINFQDLFSSQSDVGGQAAYPAWYPYRHEDGANQLFGDGHVEYAKRSVLQGTNDMVRRRWNIDDLPHPETWPSP
jgi:prepilin-type processing-associated H-X9-DG protein